MVREIVLGLTVVAFVAAAINNLTGRTALKADYRRWGFPAWWCYVTGVMALIAAGLLALPATRRVGWAIGMVIVVAAALAVVRKREYGHLAPLAVFTALLMATAFLNGV